MDIEPNTAVLHTPVSTHRLRLEIVHEHVDVLISAVGYDLVTYVSLHKTLFPH